MNTYSKKLRDPRWQKKRLEILQRDEFTCTLCGDTTTTLNVHHLEYSGDPWEADNKHLQTLCEHCHIVVEWRLKENIRDPLIIVEKGPITKTVLGTSDFLVMESYHVENGEVAHWNFVNIKGIELFLEKLKLHGQKSNSPIIL